MNRLMIVPQTLRRSADTAGRFSLLIAFALTATLATAEEVANATVELESQVAPPTENKLIYKSVDAQGRVSFGDHPGTNAVALETLERPSYQQNTSTDELQTRLDQMAATTKRLQDDRKLRAKLRHDEVEARTASAPAPVVVVENRVYRPRSYPYLYRPHHTAGDLTVSHHSSSSSLGLHLGGGSSKFHYGLSYGSQQGHHENHAIQTPYRSKQGHIRSSGLIKHRLK